MKFTVDKPKTWKGLSYPLKTSILKDAIDDAKIETTVHLKYWTPQIHEEKYNILECEFWPTSINVNYDRFYIRAGVVKSKDRKLVEDYLKSEVIPKLILFMKSKISLPDNSTKLKQGSYFKAVFTDNKILFNP
ncbi:MAG TPA: hypothetical protein VF455_11475 [Chryseobacterium sp.]